MKTVKNFKRRVLEFDEFVNSGYMKLYESVQGMNNVYLFDAGKKLSDEEERNVKSLFVQDNYFATKLSEEEVLKFLPDSILITSGKTLSDETYVKMEEYIENTAGVLEEDSELVVVENIDWATDNMLIPIADHYIDFESDVEETPIIDVTNQDIIHTYARSGRVSTLIFKGKTEDGVLKELTELLDGEEGEKNLKVVATAIEADEVPNFEM